MRALTFLAWLLLAQLNIVAAGYIGGYITNEHYRLRMVSADYEREACEGKHKALINQIKKEGLWRRLGMPGQPWLQ